MAGYSTVKACNGPLSPPSGVVTSPNWPNVYPLNAECIWSDIENATTSKNKLLHVSFSKFNLPNNHSLTLTSSVDKTPKPKVLTLTGSQVPDDVIVKGVNYTLTFSSVEKKPVLQSSVGEGFVLNYKYLECGGSITTAKDVIMSPDYPKPNNKSQICAWTIHIPDTSNNKTANILQFDLILDNKNESVKSLLEIHDGGSINDPVMILSRNATLNKTRLLSRTNKLFILYDNTATGTLGLIFHMNYSTHECNIFCDNGVCLHKDWRCNGINECGDNTDEIDCKGPGPTPAPTPTPAPHKGGSGVASYWVALCLLFGIVMGVVGVIFLPRIYRRLRFRNYNTLHEVSNPVA
ncbi:hypothetical protein SNE40_001524 [Patella caerulea]|uniref:CUB domain-containing protein n=1 Tax=Patella caerulea TaxID=87958 RepID=A0AAN8Q335_PATCE